MFSVTKYLRSFWLLNNYFTLDTFPMTKIAFYITLFTDIWEWLKTLNYFANSSIIDLVSDLNIPLNVFKSFRSLKIIHLNKVQVKYNGSATLRKLSDWKNDYRNFNMFFKFIYIRINFTQYWANTAFFYFEAFFFINCINHIPPT